MLPGQWQSLLVAENVQVTRWQQLGAVSGKAALHLLSLLVMTKTSVKAVALITCLSALPLMVGLTSCASERYNQSAGRRVEDNRTAEHGDNQSTDGRMEDSRTAQRVREALAAGVDYKYDGVKVIASNGVIQLSGFVNTNAQRNSAGEVTRKVGGVKDVVNSIEVKE
jgi:osmotically-inducible protein OsmY